jgi:tRNA (guanine-N7-)-methyltransferase
MGETEADNLTPPRRTIHGRRRGRKLKPGQAQLWQLLLPQLRFAVPASGRFDARGLFPRPPERLWLEIGFGAGEHLADQAEAHPETGMLGVDIFENGAAKLLATITRRELGNIRILLDDARLLLAALPDDSIDRVFILFPDPWPKARHHKRRIVSPATLGELARVMRGGAELRLATDDPDYLRWMLAAAAAAPDFEWLARQPADWRERPADWPPTRYEQKAGAAGRAPVFLRYRRQPRSKQGVQPAV